MIDDLNVKIFADGADLDAILALAGDERISGFTTNPTLMWKAGLTDYEEFARRLLLGHAGPVIQIEGQCDRCVRLPEMRL